MALLNIQKGKQLLPPRILIYGEHGLGKSTFASQAPAPIFIPTEDGLGALDVSAFPLARTYAAVTESLRALIDEDHKYQTVVVDSLDWLETLIWEHVSKKARLENIEAFGYGKGYGVAADEFREFLNKLNILRCSKGMGIILVAHSQVKRFDDPSSEPYDRYMLKLHAKAAGLIQEWVDVIGFAAQQIIVKKEDVGFQKKASRGMMTGGHVLHLKRTPAFDAKNRYGLPEKIALDWNSFMEAFVSATSPVTKE